ncbi:MAG: hypothetical protein ACRD09_15205 [Vicinamibacterales bacterium]
MKRLAIGLLAALVSATVPASVDDPNAAAAFERLKQLAGNWQSTAGDGKGAVTRFEIIGNGSAILEKYRDQKLGAGNEMVTMYHLDGARLLLTHYCMAKNQPRMQLASYDPASGELTFEFLDATNLPAGAGHMHRARYALEGPDRFTTVWDFVQGGKTTFSEKQQFSKVN